MAAAVSSVQIWADPKTFTPSLEWLNGEKAKVQQAIKKHYCLVNHSFFLNEGGAFELDRPHLISQGRDFTLMIHKNDPLIGKGRENEEGSFNKLIYLAIGPENRPFAVVVVRQQSYQQDTGSQEGAAMEALRDIPFTVQLECQHVEGSRRFLVEEWCQKGEVFNLVVNKELSLDEKLRFIEQLLSGVSGMHERGWVHGDLGLENLFVSLDEKKDKVLRIGDFEFSHPVTDKKGRELCAGMPVYLSPEQVVHRLSINPVSKTFIPEPWSQAEPLAERTARATDMWSVGCTLFILVTGASLPWYKCSSTRQTEVALLSSCSPKPSQREIIFDPKRLEIWADALAEVPFRSKLLDLVRDLLKADPAERPTAAEALQRYREMRLVKI
jgi:serine/threonine protein kinase